MVRLAIVGIGGYGWNLVETINHVAEEAGCRLVGAADARFSAFPKRVAELEAGGVELFDDALRMFEALRGKCEAVYIATGIHSHAPLTIAAAQAGYHVHLEKPPAATVQEADSMLEALDAAGRFCLVGFQALHSSDVQFVKDAIVSGRLGPVERMACRAGWPRTRSYYERNEWAGRLQVGDAWVLDGPAMNALSHQIANMLFWAAADPAGLAAPRSVRAELYAAGPVDSHDTAAIEIRTADGPTAYFVASHCSEADFGPIIDIEAEGTTVAWSMGEGATVTYADGSVESCEADEGHGRGKMVANFVEAVRTGDRSMLRCDLEQTRAFVLALDGAHESSQRIHRIDAPHARRAAEGTGEARTIVDGLDEVLDRAAGRGCLFSDLPSAPPWAVATLPYDLSGYQGFPQRFRCK
jgi:predicted dehydrogenase